MAEIVVQKGASALIILDINAEGLKNLNEKFSSEQCQVLTLKTDITRDEDLDKALSEIKRANLEVDILINNAGMVTGKNFSDHSREEIERNMLVNAIGPMKLTSAILPQMLERKQGHIVNISSAASMLSNPRMSVYCASKWAMTGWSDSLRIEMEQEQTGVRVLTVTPYYIDTGMFAGVKSPLVPILKPAMVAKKIIRGIESDRIILRSPWIIYTLPFVKGILPKRMLDLLIGKGLGIYHSMDKFKGRNNDEI